MFYEAPYTCFSIHGAIDREYPPPPPPHTHTHTYRIELRQRHTANGHGGGRDLEDGFVHGGIVVNTLDADAPYSCDAIGDALAQLLLVGDRASEAIHCLVEDQLADLVGDHGVIGS